MTKAEMHEAINTYHIASYYVREHEDGSVDFMFGDEDPMKKIEDLKLENALLKDQLRCMATIAYGIPYDKAEELIK